MLEFVFKMTERSTGNEENRPLSRGEFIRRARLAKELTQTELAERVARAMGRSRSFDQSMISAVETDALRWKVNDATLNALAEVLDLSVDQLPPRGEVRRREPRLQPESQSRQRVVETDALLSFGAGDRVAINRSGANLDLEFEADSYKRTVALTKYPISLGSAIGQALEREGVFEYQGENYCGRVCSWWDNTFSWVAEFNDERPCGFLIHLDEREMDAFKSELARLPLQRLLTD